MMANGSINISALQKQLQKSIIILKQCNDLITEVNSSTRPSIQSVKNLTEQYQCCAIVKLSLPTGFNFSEIKEKLLFKISTEINEEILKLYPQIERLGDYCDKMDKQYERCMIECRKCKSEEEIDYLVQRNPLYPSLSDMLNCLESIGRAMRESYSCKKYLLDSYLPDSHNVCETLEKNWLDGEKDLHTKVDDCLAFTTHFMDLKIP